MRKIILQMYITLDGYVSGPKGELDWIFNISNLEVGQHSEAILNRVDTIFLGRKMSIDFLNYWPTDITEYGVKINNLPKIIFSKTLKEVEGPNVTIISENFEQEVVKLKKQEGKDIVLYGGANLVQSFVNSNLIDEYHLYIVPIILGEGLKLFEDIKTKVNLKLIEVKHYSTGVVIVHYNKA